MFFVLSVVSCFFTYIFLSDVDSYSRSSQKIISVLYFDVAFILLLLMLASHRIFELWNERHKKGSLLTIRLIAVFSVLSVTPFVMMSIFSSVFFHNGIESWFNDRNTRVLQGSVNVAESYLSEHKKNAVNDCMAIARALEYHIDTISETVDENTDEFFQSVSYTLDDLCNLKNVKSAILLDSSLNVVARTKYSVGLHFLNISYTQLQAAVDKQGIALDENVETESSIYAISHFKNPDNESMYLIIEKAIDSKIISYAKDTRNAFDEYYDLLQERSHLEVACIFMFLVFGILLLISSITVAIIYSWRIVNPVSNLINVSESIIGGNLNARATEGSSYEEISLLSRTFNQMIDRVHNQQKDLLNKKLDERIKFTSSVLAGVSSGVIGLENNAIYIWNNAAEKLLGKQISFGNHIDNLMPEVTELVAELNQSQKISLEREIHYKKDAATLIFLVKLENITTQDDDSVRFVITFDDLTEVVLAQRRAAWTDVARRVAHEIKNPLTPIQLSAERLRRKYISQISSEPKVFSDMIDVIVRQVGDIKRLIDDFTFYARLPEPIMKECDATEICRQAILFMQQAENNVEISLINDNKQQLVKADERLLHQCVVNLIKNAMNALNTIDIPSKKITVQIKKDEEKSRMLICINDNGPGFPKEKFEMLATPYFTLMPKGTGLGLAIVKKIVQDHGGELLFDNNEFGGASATISLPID